MEHLAGRGIVCPLPVPARDGARAGTLNGRPCAFVTFLTGLSVRRPTVGHCAAAGAALARLHLAGADFALGRANALGPDGWAPLVASTAAGADRVEDGLQGLIATSFPAITAAWPALPRGVIHADFFPDNVLFMRDEVSGIIDFYFACNDMYAYDLAVMLNSWCFEADGGYNLTKGMALANAYRAVRPLDEAEIAAMPVLMRAAALRFLLTRLHDWINHDAAALVTPKDPREYSKKLRFHLKVARAKEYGIE
jgi:homoserine kinase type II